MMEITALIPRSLSTLVRIMSKSSSSKGFLRLSISTWSGVSARELTNCHNMSCSIPILVFNNENACRNASVFCNRNKAGRTARALSGPSVPWVAEIFQTSCAMESSPLLHNKEIARANALGHLQFYRVDMKLPTDRAPHRPKPVIQVHRRML